MREIGYGADDFGEEDRRADVRARKITEDHAEGADDPYHRVNLAIGSADEPDSEDIDPSLVCESLDEDELGEREGYECEWESRECGGQGREPAPEAVVHSAELGVLAFENSIDGVVSGQCLGRRYRGGECRIMGDAITGGMLPVDGESALELAFDDFIGIRRFIRINRGVYQAVLVAVIVPGYVPYEFCKGERESDHPDVDSEKADD